MRYFLLFDNKGSDKNFISDQIGLPVAIYFSPESKKKIFGWIKGVLKIISISRRNDTIICWFDFQAVLCFWICRLLFLRRNIICINILLKIKSTWKNRIVSYLYKKALLSPNFKASVTSFEYGNWLNSHLGIDVKYTLIHDVYHEFYAFQGKVETKPGTVFCGGYNGRDWGFITEIAKKLPEVTFNFIMPYNVYQQIKSDIPSNVNAKCNIPYDQFMYELCSSSLVCLPLNTEAPAGLIVMFQAAANMKYIITTDTCTTREYLSDGKGSLIPNITDTWVSTIKERLQMKKENENASDGLLRFLRTKCSEREFVDGIKKMIGKRNINI